MKNIFFKLNKKAGFFYGRRYNNGNPFLQITFLWVTVRLYGW